MDTIISLSKRRGFIYPSSEIYGGFAGIYDLGPMGVELANNIKTQWWNVMVRRRKDIVGLDSAIFMHPKIWVASGHVAGFSDPLIECKDCHARSRADKLLEEIPPKPQPDPKETLIRQKMNEILRRMAIKELETQGKL